MLIREKRHFNGQLFDYTYSDLSVYIKQIGTGNIYDAAYDMPGSDNDYIETEEKIQCDEEDVV